MMIHRAPQLLSRRSFLMQAAGLATAGALSRPAFGQTGSTVGMFKLKAGTDEAVRVQVQLGRSSVHTVEVVMGLQVGDTVILSDTSAWDAFDRIRLN